VRRSRCRRIPADQSAGGEVSAGRESGGPWGSAIVKRGNWPMAHFPQRLRTLPKFEGPFDAFRLAANGCDVLFASYPAGTNIPEHEHATENFGVITQGALILMRDGHETRYATGEWYHLPAGARHAARFEQDTAEIEFWFQVS
jgi:mannose-6-phosphate isomerase-like protein (cupin superfamily)